MTNVGRTALALVPMIAGVLAASTGPATAKGAAFQITTTWIVNWVEPKPRSVLTRTTYYVTLKPNGSIEEKVETRYGNGNPGPRLIARDTALGEAGGRRGTTMWKVVNESTLVRLFGRASHTFVIWVRTEGDGSCKATLEWRLKPGFSLYEIRNRSDKVTARFTEPSWPNARCDVL